MGIGIEVDGRMDGIIGIIGRVRENEDASGRERGPSHRNLDQMSMERKISKQ